MKQIIQSTLMIFLLSSPIFAWGPTGHRTVGQIAETLVRPQVRQELRKILGSETLAEAANWPDEVRLLPEYEYSKPWHYVQIPDGVTYDPKRANPKGNIIEAIAQQREILADKSRTNDDHKMAVRFLAHFVGDMHQPFHVGNGLDSGANACAVRWWGAETNLHAVWDNLMIDNLRLSFTELSKLLLSMDSHDIAEWKKGAVLDWANEGREIREDLYPKNKDGERVRPEDRKYCRYRNANPVSAVDMPALGEEYLYRSKPIIERQLAKAGVRLAVVLESALLTQQ